MTAVTLVPVVINLPLLLPSARGRRMKY
jgi:hypothetical protein